MSLSYNTVDWNSVLSKVQEKTGKCDFEKNFPASLFTYATVSNGGERVTYDGKSGRVILDWDGKKREWEAFERDMGEISWSPKKFDEEDKSVLSSYAKALEEYLK
jgi:hypothetical protein